MSKFLCSILAVSVLLSLLTSARLTAQQEQSQKPDFGEGRFEEISERMERIIRLEWAGENIQLVRRWPGEENDLTADQKKAFHKAVRELIDRGVPREQARKLTLEKMGFEHPPLGVAACFNKAFNKLVDEGEACNASLSFGREHGPQFSTTRMSALGKHETHDPHHKMLRFSFEEFEFPKRSFKLRDDGNGTVHFQFERGDQFVRLLQDKDGSTQLISVKIKHQKRDGEDEAKKLIFELGSENYEVRENASKKLAAGYDNWASAIYKYLDDPSLSPEAAFRLNEIVDNSPVNELENCIHYQNQEVAGKPEVENDHEPQKKLLKFA